MAKSNLILAPALLVLAMSLTGMNVAIGKPIVAEMPVYLFLGIRFAIATSALALLSRHEPGPRLVDLPRSQWMTIVVILAGVGSVLFTVFLLEGVKRTSASDAGIITATIPAVVALLGFVFRSERLSAMQVAAIGAAVTGIVLMQLGAGQTGSAASSVTGNLLIGGAVLCEAIFVMQSGRIGGLIKPIRLSLAVAAASLVLSLPLAIAEFAQFNPATVSGTTWLLVVWYALAASVLCPMLWYRGAVHVETWMAGLATAAMPVSALAIAVAILNEPLGSYRLGGAVLVVAAIVLGSFSQRATPQPPP